MSECKTGSTTPAGPPPWQSLTDWMTEWFEGYRELVALVDDLALRLQALEQVAQALEQQLEQQQPGTAPPKPTDPAPGQEGGE